MGFRPAGGLISVAWITVRSNAGYRFCLPIGGQEVDPFKSDLKRDVADLVGAIADFNLVDPGAWHLIHLPRNRVVTIPRQAVNDGANQEVGAKVLAQAIEFVNIAFTISNVHTAIREAQKSNGLSQVIEPSNALLAFDGNTGRIYFPFELSRPFEFVSIPELHRCQGLLGQPAWLKEAGEVRPLAQLWDPKLHGPGSCLPVPITVAVSLN